MHIKHLTPELVRGLDAAPAPTPEHQNKLEVRLLAALITFSFINDQIGPITYVFHLAPSMLYHVASLSHASWLIGWSFLTAALLALPHMVALLFMPKTLSVRWPRKLATLGASLVFLTWAYLGVLALPLDVGPLPWLYFRQALEALLYAVIYALSLNAQLVRAVYLFAQSHEAPTRR